MTCQEAVSEDEITSEVSPAHPRDYKELSWSCWGNKLKDILTTAPGFRETAPTGAPTAQRTAVVQHRKWTS